MKRKFISYFLVLVMLLSVSNLAFAKDYVADLSVGHAPGDSYRTVDNDDCIAMEGAKEEGGGIKITAGGYAVYGYHTPYGTRAVTIHYEDAEGTLTIDTGENVYTVEELDESGEYKLVFGENLGIPSQDYLYNGENSTGYQREFVEHRGEHEVKVSTTGKILINKMVFEKEYTPDPLVKRTVDVSAGVSATYSTVMLDENATIIVANGGRRYIDNNDKTMTPYEYNGRLYLPINTLAKALEYYHEDYPEKGYALMRSDTHEVALLDGIITVTEGTGETVVLDEEVIIQRDGKTFAAVRYFGELIGDTVEYRDGLVVIDNKYTVDSIIKDGELHSFAIAKFSPFKKQRKSGNTYYVAQNNPNASDENNGTAVAPFKTLKKAANVAKAGDTVIVREGVYRETLAPKNDGTVDAPITFKAMDGERVVISANEVLDGGWAQYDTEKNIWVTPMTWDLGITRNQIFINDEMQLEARYPNGPEVFFDTDRLSDAWMVRGDMWKPAGQEGTKEYQTIRSSTLFWQDEPDYWKGAQYIGVIGTAYATTNGDVVGSSKGEIYIGDRREARWQPGEAYHTISWGYLVGSMNCLDAPGEWIHESNSLYMIFPEGAEPGKTVVEAKKRQLAIDLTDRKFINIDGFETIGGSALMKNSELCSLNALDIKYSNHFITMSEAYKGGLDFPYNKTDTNGAVERGEFGVFITGTDNMITNCNFDHAAGAGIFLSGLYCYIENNIFADCGYGGSYVSGIYAATRPYDPITKPVGGFAVYNNTVYNCGRSCMCLSSADGHYVPTYIPIETAYNDFHDGMATTVDTGITYEYCIQQSIDGYSSRLHHNYVYTTLDERDANAYGFAIYHDGGSHGYDTYDNQVFSAKPNAPLTRYTYTQSYTGAASFQRRWNNEDTIYVPDGIDGLNEEYFTEEKPFYAGALRDIKTYEPIDYTKNYDRIKEGRYTMKYTVLNSGTLSDGVTLDKKSGYASFTGDGQYVKFSNIEFPGGTEMVKLAVRGDSHHCKDKLEVIVCNPGEGMEKGKVYDAVVDLNAYDKDTPESIRLYIDPTSGVCDVYVKVVKYNSVQLGGIGAYAVPDRVRPDYDWSAFRWAGEFTDRTRLEIGGGTGPMVSTLPELLGHKTVKELYPGWYIRYEDVSFETDTDTFVISSGSGGQYAGLHMAVYVDSFESEPVAKFIEDSTEWSDREPQLVQLNKTVSAGTHDVILEFRPEGGMGKTGTALYIGFLKQGSTITDDLNARVYGYQYDKESSKPDAKWDFHTEYMDPPKVTFMGVNYTLPGTHLAYKNVAVSGDSTKFVIRYSAEPQYANQPIEVRLGSPTGELIAEYTTSGIGYLNNQTDSVDLKRPLEAGTYDVYLCFGGESGTIKTCNLTWFGFDE